MRANVAQVISGNTERVRAVGALLRSVQRNSGINRYASQLSASALTLLLVATGAYVAFSGMGARLAEGALTNAYGLREQVIGSLALVDEFSAGERARIASGLENSRDMRIASAGRSIDENLSRSIARVPSLIEDAHTPIAFVPPSAPATVREDALARIESMHLFVQSLAHPETILSGIARGYVAFGDFVYATTDHMLHAYIASIKDTGNALLSFGTFSRDIATDVPYQIVITEIALGNAINEASVLSFAELDALGSLIANSTALAIQSAPSLYDQGILAFVETAPHVASGIVDGEIAVGTVAQESVTGMLSVQDSLVRGSVNGTRMAAGMMADGSIALASAVSASPAAVVDLALGVAGQSARMLEQGSLPEAKLTANTDQASDLVANPLMSLDIDLLPASLRAEFARIARATASMIDGMFAPLARFAGSPGTTLLTVITEGDVTNVRPGLEYPADTDAGTANGNTYVTNLYPQAGANESYIDARIEELRSLFYRNISAVEKRRSRSSSGGSTTVVNNYGAATESPSFSAFDFLAVGRNSTTTIVGDNGTSTFSGGILATDIEATGSIAGPYVLATSPTATSVFSGSVTVGNDVTLGSNASDTLTVNSRISSDLIPSATNTYDLGSTTSAWRAGYFTGAVNAGSFVSAAASDGCASWASGVLTSIGVPCGSGSGGLTSLNGQTGAVQTFATSSANGGWGFASAGDVHTLNIPVASASNALGLLSNTDWSTFNAKQAALSFVYPLVNTANSISLAFGTTTNNIWAGTQTFADLLATNATTTSFGINSETFLDLTGSGLTNVGGVLTLDRTGDWTGTFDGQEGTYYLNRANHTGTQLASTISDFDTAVNTFVAASTTIAKTYQPNTWTGLQTFGNGIAVTGEVAADYFTAASVTATSTFPLANITSALRFGSDYLTDLTGSGLSIVGNALTIGTVGQANGGTGFTTYAAGDLLYADLTGTLAKLPVGTAGQVLKVAGGVPSWGADLTTGGGGGAGAWATTTDSLAIYPADTSDVVIIGSSATTTANSIFEVFGTSYFSNTLGIATTAPGSLLSIGGVANFTTATSTFYGTGGINLASGCFAVGGNCLSLSSLTGTLSVARGGTGSTTLTGILKGNGTGSILTAVAGTDYQAPLSFLYPLVNTANSISLAFGTTTANAWSALQTFNGGVTIGTLNGPLQANNGVVSATTSIGALYGGTGSTTLSGILVGNGTSAVNSLVLPSFLTLSGNTLSLGTLGIANGGTATTTFYNGGVVFSDGTKLTQSSAPANFFWNETNKFLGLGTSSPWAQLSINPDNIAGPALAIGSSTGTSFMVTNGGNVGIGTSTVGSKLTLAGGNFTQLASGNPTQKGVYNTTGNAGTSVIVGKYAYVADDTAGLQIIDVSNPALPTLVSTLDTSGFATDIAVAGKYAYISDYAGGLKVIDISNPISPILVGTYSTGAFAYFSLAVSGKYAYVVDITGATMIVIDISNPAAPVGVASLSGLSSPQDIQVVGKYAYIADNFSGLRIVDISNPLAPRLISTTDTPWLAYGVYVSGKYAYIGDGDTPAGGIKIIDISNAASPSVVGALDTTGNAKGIYVSGRYAYVADGSSGIQVIDVASSTAPSLVGTYNTSGSAYGVTVVGKYAYVADLSAGLQIIDINGTEVPALYAGNIATNILNASEGITSGGDISAWGSLFAGNGLNVNGFSNFSASTTKSQNVSILSVSNATSTQPLFTALYNGNIGIGTSSPFAKLSLHAFDGETNRTLFTIGSSTAAATSTLFSIGNDGVITSAAAATSTFTNGLAVTGGCVSVGGVCLTSSTGSVTSVNASGGTTGLTFSGGPVTSSGTLTLAGTLGVANGGTGAVTLTGLLKGNGTSPFTAAVAGTDYQAPLSFVYPLVNTANSISLAFGTTTANQWSALQEFNGGASTTQLTVTGNTYFPGSGIWSSTGSVGIGTTTPLRLLHIVSNTATTDSTDYLTRLTRNTSGTAAVGLGVGEEFELENDGGALATAGTVEFIWSNAAAGTETSDFIVSSRRAGVATTSFRAVNGAIRSNAVQNDASVPAFSFENDTNSGLTSISNDVIGLGVGGNTIARISANGLYTGGSTALNARNSLSSSGIVASNAAVGLFGGTTNTMIAALGNAQALTISASDVYTGVLIPAGTISGSGTTNYQLLAQMAIKPFVFTPGSATVVNSASLYIEDAAAAGSTAGDYALWVDNGTSRFDGSVGIGTSTPGSLLSIGGVANFGTATSTFYSSGGLNLTGGGCYAVNGTCVTNFSNTLANGGTATTTFYNGGVVFSDGTKLTQSSSPSNFFWSESNARLGLGSSTPWAQLSIALLHSLGITEQLRLGYNTSNYTSFTTASNGAFTIAPVGAAGGVSLYAGNGIASNGWAIGGTDIRGLLTLQKSDTSTYSVNADMGDAGRTFVMENTNTGNNANQFANITLQINPNGNIGSGRVLGDFRLIRETANSTNSFFLFSAFRQDGTYKDFARIGFDTSYFVGNLGIGSTTPWAQLSVNPDGITGPAFAIGSTTSTSFVVTNGGNVGVGTTTPGATLSVQAGSTIKPLLVSSSAGSTLLSIDGSGNAAIGGAYTGTGISTFSTSATAAVVQFQHTANSGSDIYGANVLSTNTAATGGSIGLRSVSIRQGAGTATSHYGVYGLAQYAGASTQATTSGIYGLAQNTGAGSITDAFSIYGDLPTASAGSITRAWAGGFNGNVWIGGSVGIATTSPGSLLSIGGVANFGTATSTFYSSGGLNLTGGGCYAVNGTCVTNFSNTLANGGTATTTFYNGGVVFSDGTKLTQSSSPSNFFWSESNARLGLGSSTPWAQLSIFHELCGYERGARGYRYLNSWFNTCSGR
ncbi:MAG: hypothetical protein AB199_04240 [Parcubacteria bacterium C7867-004]|nr:MAG: hypothetical protein AB199_04240 [Parcubacteria bacterium C7867-004]